MCRLSGVQHVNLLSRVPIVTNERLRRFVLRSYNIQYHGLSLGIPSNIFCIEEQEQSDFHFVPPNAQIQADAVWAETGASHIPTLFENHYQRVSLAATSRLPERRQSFLFYDSETRRLSRQVFPRLRKILQKLPNCLFYRGLWDSRAS